jgi:hypothetical protein
MMMATKEQIEAVLSTLLDGDAVPSNEQIGRIIDAANAPLLEALRVAYGELSECYDLEDPVSYVTMLDTVRDVLAALRPFLIEEGKDA